MKNRVQMAINVLVIIFMPFMMYINISYSTVNFAIADIIMVLVGIMFLFNMKEFLVEKRWLYLLYFAGLLLSLLLSQYLSQLDEEFLHVEDSTMIIEMVKTIVVAMYFFTSFMFVKNNRDYELSLIAISLSSIPVIVIGAASYIYFLLGKDFFIHTYKIDSLRFVGSFKDPNLCAFYFILVFFISFLNFNTIKNKFLKFTVLGIGILSSIIILLTMSRGGLLAIAGAGVVFSILNIKRLKKESLLAIIFAVLMLFVSVKLDYDFQNGRITINIINRIQDTMNTDVEGINRVKLIKAAFSMGNDNFFFGVGKGSFPLNSYRYLSRDSIEYKMKYIPHNTVLGFYAQQGIVGVLAFIVLPVHILYRMLRSKRKQNLYLIPLFCGMFIHSMTINVENVRFLWYILGLMLAAERAGINLDFVPAAKINKRTFNIVFMVLIALVVFFYIDISHKVAVNIYTYKGDVYEKEISEIDSGEYRLTFDIQTDDNLHIVEIYNRDKLIKRMNFKSAYGFFSVPIYIKEGCRVVFKSHEEGWMKVKNAYIIGDNMKVPLCDYILLPKSVEERSNDQGLLVYSDEPSFKKQFEIEDDKLNAFEMLDAKVTRYSNISHVFQFDLKSIRKVEANYQLDLLLEYKSISSLLPNEDQKNLWSHRFTLSPLTSKWEKDQGYTVKSSRMLSSEAFDLYGRYYDYTNEIYSQYSYFPIQYELVKESQKIIELGESQWINIRYNRDEEGNIHITNNGWVETGRMNIPKGDYNITFKAQGSFMDEYSKLRLRDSYLNEIAEITLADTMKKYTVKYHTDEDLEGISFILELVNYKSEKGVGNREVLLEDWVRVK